MAPANTPPSNAVFDGCKYYYLPWTEDKSCTCVEAYWEDITFRLEPLNAMHRIIDQLVNELCLSFGRLHWLYTVNPRVLKQNLYLSEAQNDPIPSSWTELYPFSKVTITSFLGLLIHFNTFSPGALLEVRESCACEGLFGIAARSKQKSQK